MAVEYSTGRENESVSGEFEPILAGFWPDPTICRVGADYYLANSSFEYFPGAPIFHSRDLRTWKQLGNILTTRDQFRRGDRRSSSGIYGSTLRHHDGRFWFITTNVSDYGAGQVLVHSEGPTGPWSGPIFVPSAVGIDPDLCWDNGTCFITWHALDFSTGDQSIRQAPIDLTTGLLLAESYEVWQGSSLPAAEGPHLYHIGKTWYLVLAEGGTERGHCVTVARAPHPSGPFEACPHNPIFTRRSTFHPVQSVGHADLVETADGDWAAVYLGTRPRGSTPGFHVLGRETFLAGIDWVDGWPHFDLNRYSIPLTLKDFCDDFSANELHPRWVVPGGEAANFAIPSDKGLILRPTEEQDHAQLCFRVTDPYWQAEAVLEGRGRFALRMDNHHWFGLELEAGFVGAVSHIAVRHEFQRIQVPPGLVTMRIESIPPSSRTIPLGDAGPDEVVLSVLTDAGFTELARLDGRYLSTEVAAGFTGRVISLCAIAKPVQVYTVSYQGRFYSSAT